MPKRRRPTKASKRPRRTSSRASDLPTLASVRAAARELLEGGQPAEARRSYDTLLASAGGKQRAQIHNDLAVIAALEGDWGAAREGFQRALELDPALSEASQNLLLLTQDHVQPSREVKSNQSLQLADRPGTAEAGTPVHIAVLSLLFNWPSTGGGIVHTMELVHFLERAGFVVRHILARNLEWGVGRVDAPLPYEPEVLEFTSADWRADRIQHRFREAVVAFGPDHVLITDSWNFKPRLAEAVRGFPYSLRLQAQECLCPLNNLRLLPRFEQCLNHQLADSRRCAECVGQLAQHAGSLHQAERTLAGVGTEEYAHVLRQAFAEAETVFVVNPLNEALVGPYCRQVRVVPSGFDPARFPWSNADKSAAGHEASRRTRLIMAGLVDDPSKGFAVLHAACAQLWQRRRDFELWVTADPPGQQDEFTQYIGWLRQEDLPGRMRAADIVIVPPVAQDALGRTAVEGMGAGRPVIASRLGGLPFTVADGAGLLFEPGDPKDLAANIELLLDDPELRAQMGRLGRRRFETHYTWQAIIDRHYRPLLSPRQAPAHQPGRYSPAIRESVDERQICDEATAFFGMAQGEAKRAWDWYQALRNERGYARTLGEHKTLASEEAYLIGLALSLFRPASVFEIGAQHGKSTRRILDLIRALGLPSRMICFDLVDELLHVQRQEVELRIEDITGRFRREILEASPGGLVFLDSHGYRLVREIIEEMLTQRGPWILAIHDCSRGLCNPHMSLNKEDPQVTSLTGIWERHILSELFGVADPLNPDLDCQETATHRFRVFSTRHGLALLAPREVFPGSEPRAGTDKASLEVRG